MKLRGEVSQTLEENVKIIRNMKLGKCEKTPMEYVKKIKQ
jgi:hypothetical protein